MTLLLLQFTKQILICLYLIHWDLKLQFFNLNTCEKLKSSGLGEKITTLILDPLLSFCSNVCSNRRSFGLLFKKDWFLYRDLFYIHFPSRKTLNTIKKFYHLVYKNASIDWIFLWGTLSLMGNGTNCKIAHCTHGGNKGFGNIYVIFMQFHMIFSSKWFLLQVLNRISV